MDRPQKIKPTESIPIQQSIMELTERLRGMTDAERTRLQPQLEALRPYLDIPQPASHAADGDKPAGGGPAPQPSTGWLPRRLLEAIFAAHPGGLAVVTIDDRVYQMVNQAYQSLTPHPVVDPLGKRMDEIWPAEDIAKTLVAFRRVSEGGQPIKTDFERMYADGEIRYFTAHLGLLDWNGRPAVLIALWETTEFQRVQQYLVESEERFRLALAHMPDTFVIYGPDRRIQFVSNATMLPSDRAMSDFIGRRDEEIWPESVTAHYLPRLLETYATRQMQRFEVSADLPNGRSYTWIITYEPVLDERGEIRQVMGITQDITERVRAVHELKASQAALINERNRLLAVLDSLPVGVSIVDRQGGVSLANQAFEDVWGGSPPPTSTVADYAVYQAWWAETGQPVQPEAWAAAVAVQKGETVRGQFLRIRRFDGSYGHVINSGAPIYDADGTIAGATVAIMDVTARVEAEEALRGSEQALRETSGRFEAMANNIPQLAWMADPSGWIFWYNQRWYEYTGTTFEEMEGWGWQKIHHPDYVEAVTAKFRDCIARGEAWEDTFPLRGKDGQYRWFLSRATPIRDTAGNITRWFGTNTDVTEQRESQERFRVALANVPLLVYTCDRELRYTWVYNPLRGFKAEEVLGKRDEELLPSEGAADLVAAKQRALDTGCGAVQEVKIRFGDLVTYYILTTEPVKDPDGQVVGLTCSAIDITEQRQLAEAQQRLTEEDREQRAQVEIQRQLLEYREKERQGIARDLHDGPIQMLAGTIFHLQVVREAIQDGLLKIELDQTALNLKAAVRELREMVNELRPPALLHFGLTKSARMHAEDFRERHPGLKLTLNMIDDKGLLSEQACLALFRIYQEALNNVVKHAEASQVWVRLARKGKQVRLEIRDNGKGVALTGSLAEQTNKGHFGLAGMRERAQAVGGTLEVVSDPGKGTRVVVRVPIE